MAFIMAAKLAYKAAIPEAGPVLLEPIGALKAHVPADNTGDIMGEVTKRRGRVLGMNPMTTACRSSRPRSPWPRCRTSPPSCAS